MEGFVEADGARLEVRSWGPGPDAQRTIVLLHEGLGSVSAWRDWPERLADETGWGVVAYSRRGYGRSDPAPLPRPINYMEYEAEVVLPQVLDAIDFRRGVLLGHSDGGSIAALNLGGVRDHRIRGAILMAPHFFVEDCSVDAIRKAREAYEKGDLRSRLQRHHDDVDNAFRGWNDAWLNPDFRDWDITQALWPIQVPVLAIQGAEDPYGTRAQVDVIGEEMYAPAEIHLLDGCGHAPHRDRAETTLKLIVDFLRRLERIDFA